MSNFNQKVLDKETGKMWTIQRRVKKKLIEMDSDMLLLWIYLRVQIIYYKYVKIINGNMNK